MTLSYEEARSRSREAARKAAWVSYHVQRAEAMDAYGGQCAVCSNDDRTTLNVVPKSGYRWTAERAGRKLRSREKMRWLQQNGYPDDFTLVCSRTRSGRCWTRLQGLATPPHEVVSCDGLVAQGTTS